MSNANTIELLKQSFEIGDKTALIRAAIRELEEIEPETLPMFQKDTTNLESEIKRLQAMNPFQVDIPIAIRISDNLFVYGNGEETAALQNMLEQLAAKDSFNVDLMANCNQLRDRCWKAEGELARWQKIAINERARVLYFAHAGDDMYDMACLEESEHHKDRHMREAAKELSLESI